jgi:hypothetical protein
MQWLSQAEHPQSLAAFCGIIELATIQSWLFLALIRTNYA